MTPLEGNPERSSLSPPLREPFKLCTLAATRPHLCFGMTLGTHVLALVVSGALLLAGYDLFPVEFTKLPLDLRESTWYRRNLAWSGRNEFKNRVVRILPANKTKVSWPQAHRTSKSLMLLYIADEGNIFTKENFQIMQQIEDSLTKVKGYKNFCQLTESGTCTPALSVLRFFDGSLSQVDPVFYDPHFDNIVKVLNKAYTMNITKPLFRYALSKVHTINSTYVHVQHSRSAIPFGYPLKGLTESQRKVALLHFLKQDLKPMMEHYLKTKQFTFLFYCEPLMIADGTRQAYEDMKLAIGSVIFIFGFILLHTRSLWTTILGIFSIVCSFVETNFIYRVVIGYRYFGFFHVLVMFIILGIGADDLFVFWDAWKASELRHFPTLAHRLDETYRKSALSMFVTSFTTMLAFLVSGLSPLLATRSFGVFSAMLVIVDYISVITFFPTIVIVYHLHFEGKSFLQCCKCWKWCPYKRKQTTTNRNSNSVRDGNDDDDPSLTDEGEVDRNLEASDTAPLQLDFFVNLNRTGGHGVMATKNIHAPSPCKLTQNVLRVSGNSFEECGTLQIHEDQPAVCKEEQFTDIVSANRNNSAEFENETQEQEATDASNSRDEKENALDMCVGKPKHRLLVVFFRDTYLHFVTHKVGRWVILLVLLALIVFFGISVSNLKPDNQQVGLFKESHHYTRAFRLSFNGFAGEIDELSINVRLLWGVKERDLSSCPFADYHCEGREVFDDSFDPSTEQAQRSLMKLCDTLNNFTDKEADAFKIRRDYRKGRLDIFCFMDSLAAYLKNDTRFSGVDVSLPWNKAKLDTFVTSLKPYYDLPRFNSSFRHYLNVPVNYWLWDGYRQTDTDDLNTFSYILGQEATPYTTRIPSVPGIQIGNRLKFVGIVVGTTLQYETLSYTEHIPVVDRWERFMQHQLSTMPPEMKGGFQITSFAWHWLFVQKSLVDNAMTGVILGVFLTLPILVLSTGNVFNGFLATLSICCVTVCVIGVVPLAGWKLGVLVSLNMCLVVGLAVDYVVHLAEGYHMSHARDRKTRLKDSLERMGISVFSGACTTLGASVFMLFAQIQFFFQFGIFLFCTIGFSFLFSFGFYATLMGMVGPEGDAGNIFVPIRSSLTRIRSWHRSRALHVSTSAARKSKEPKGYDDGDSDDIDGRGVAII